MPPIALTRAPHPTDELVAALYRLRDLLGRDYCYALRGRYHFRLDGSWTLALSADSASRFRLDACQDGVTRRSLWVLSEDHARLERVVLKLTGASAPA